MTTQFKFGQYPDINGYFGRHGGRFVSETLMAALEGNLTKFIKLPKLTLSFGMNLWRFGTDYVGRPTPLYFAERLTQQVGGAQIFLSVRI